MASQGLFHDHTISVSATLAATLGLEAAILLSFLHQAGRFQCSQSIRLERELIRQYFPFWDDVSIRGLFSRLSDQGLIQVDGPMYPEQSVLEVRIHEMKRPDESATNLGTQHTPVVAPASSQTLNHPQARQHLTEQSQPERFQAAHARPQGFQPEPSARTVEPIPTTSASFRPLADHWQPSADTLKRLEQHAVPASYAWSLLDEFLLQGKEQGQNRNDWNTRFFRFVKKHWVHTQNSSGRHFPIADGRPEPTTFSVQQEEAAPIPQHWQPADDAIQILTRSGVSEHFIQDAIPEFVLYWSERGDAVKTWNTKFLTHVRQQWARYQATEQHAATPLPISANWQPSADCYDILSMAHIDENFARAKIAEFVLYWRDSGQVHTSWNSRFLQYVKQQWGQRLPGPAASGAPHGANTQSVNQPGYSTAEASVRRLQDTSW